MVKYGSVRLQLSAWRFLIRCCIAEFLQGRLLLETTRPEFSEMPFRFAEIAKVLLDVYVFITFYSLAYLANDD